MKKLTSLLLILSLSGCATLLSGTIQTINIKAIDSNNYEALSKVNCIVREPNGATHKLESNPGTISIGKGDGTLNIICQKNGYTQGKLMVGNDYNPVTLVNVLFWPGYIVDAVTGSYKKYPSHLVVSMDKIEHSQ